MRAPVSFLRPACEAGGRAALAVVVGLMGLMASMDARGDDPEDANWMPSMTIGVGVATMSISGQTRSENAEIPQESGDSYISEFFQFEGRLHTPLILDIPSRPRLFLSGGFQLPLAEELIAERVDVSSINRYEPPNGNRLADPTDDSALVTQSYRDFCPDTVPALRNERPVTLPDDVPRNPLARGESCSLRIRGLITVTALWYAGLGVDFSIPMLDFVFRLQPSIDYFGMAVQSQGRVIRETLAPTLDSFEEFASGVGNEEVRHGVSPSLSIAADVHEEGPWRWSMYVQGRAIHFLNQPDIDSRAALQGNALTFVGGTDDWMWQAGAGVRLMWTGRD